MSIPFREFGLGSNSLIAFEYAHIKTLGKKKDYSLGNILDKRESLEIRKPENMSSSKLELKIWIAHDIHNLKQSRELTKTETECYEFIINQYGEKGKEILSIYKNKDISKCISILMNDDEIIDWKRKNNCIRKPGKVWRFIGHCCRYYDV